MGIFGFVLSGGGALGVLAGGILTDFLDWHWIFLVNLPIGVLVFALSLKLLPITRKSRPAHRLRRRDHRHGGLMLAVYAIVTGTRPAGRPARRSACSAGARCSARSWSSSRGSPSRSCPSASSVTATSRSPNGVGVLMAAGMFAYFFFSALYLQQVLGYTPLEVGLACLRRALGRDVLYSDKFVMRYGIKKPLDVGLGLMALGLLLFARVPVDGNVLIDVIPATLAIGLGGGIAFNPLLLAAMGDVKPEESGSRPGSSTRRS